MATIGQTLGDARREQGLSIDDVAYHTRIHSNMIECIETDDFSMFASVAYAKSFVRKYSEYLNVDVSDAMHALNSGVAVRFSDNELMGEMKKTIKKDRLFRFERAGKRPPRRLLKSGGAPVLLNIVLVVLISAMGVFYFLGYNASSPEEARYEITNGLKKAAPFVAHEESLPTHPLAEGKFEAQEESSFIAPPVEGLQTDLPPEVIISKNSPIEKPEIQLNLEEQPAPMLGDRRNASLPLRPRDTAELPLETDLSASPIRSADLPVMRRVNEELAAPVQLLEMDSNPASPQQSGKPEENSVQAPRPDRLSPKPRVSRAVPVAATES